MTMITIARAAQTQISRSYRTEKRRIVVLLRLKDRRGLSLVGAKPHLVV